MNKKRNMIFLSISLIVFLFGITYAYYNAMVQGTGNTNAETSATTATLGEVEYNGVSTFDSSTFNEIYPGFIGVQVFTIEPATDGSGIYEIDLEATVPEAFGSDIKLTLYKTSDSTNNYITRTEGTLAQNSIGFYKQDTLTTTGTLTKVYEGTLSTTSETMLEQVEFTIANDSFTMPTLTPDGYYTYYAVYEYISRETSQDSQQNLDFEAKITLKYVSEITVLPVYDVTIHADVNDVYSLAEAQNFEPSITIENTGNMPLYNVRVMEQRGASIDSIFYTSPSASITTLNPTDIVYYTNAIRNLDYEGWPTYYYIIKVIAYPSSESSDNPLIFTYSKQVTINSN